MGAQTSFQTTGTRFWVTSSAWGPAIGERTELMFHNKYGYILDKTATMCYDVLTEEELWQTVMQMSSFDGSGKKDGKRRDST